MYSAHVQGTLKTKFHLTHLNEVLLTKVRKMPGGKLRKSQRTSKNKNNEQSDILASVDKEGTRIKAGWRVPKPVDSAPDQQKAAQGVQSRAKAAKQVHFAFLPEKYEPLEEDQDLDIPDIGKEENKKSRKKYKMFRNNIGKALRYSWKCLVVGLQSFSAAYSGPLSTATTLIAEVRR